MDIKSHLTVKYKSNCWKRNGYLYAEKNGNEMYFFFAGREIHSHDSQIILIIRTDSDK